MKHIEFFAGIGGFSKGLEGVSVPVAFSEIDPYACRVYSRHWPTGTCITFRSWTVTDW